jgi:hypothetical protein
VEELVEYCRQRNYHLIIPTVVPAELMAAKKHYIGTRRLRSSGFSNEELKSQQDLLEEDLKQFNNHVLVGRANRQHGAVNQVWELTTSSTQAEPEEKEFE